MYLGRRCGGRGAKGRVCRGRGSRTRTMHTSTECGPCASYEIAHMPKSRRTYGDQGRGSRRLRQRLQPGRPGMIVLPVRRDELYGVVIATVNRGAYQGDKGHRDGKERGGGRRGCFRVGTGHYPGQVANLNDFTATYSRTSMGS